MKWSVWDISAFRTRACGSYLALPGFTALQHVSDTTADRRIKLITLRGDGCSFSPGGVHPADVPPSVRSQYLLGSNAQGSAEQRKGRFPIWPEWSEVDINAEKWDAGKTGKEKDKTAKSPVFVSEPGGARLGLR